jgi:hypothetical protein
MDTKCSLDLLVHEPYRIHPFYYRYQTLLFRFDFACDVLYDIESGVLGDESAHLCTIEGSFHSFLSKEISCAIITQKVDCKSSPCYHCGTRGLLFSGHLPQK